MNSKFLVQLRESKLTRKKGCRKWMLRSQIAAKYDNNWEIADQICNDKLADPDGEGKQWKKNPDSDREAWGFTCEKHQI